MEAVLTAPPELIGVVAEPFANGMEKRYLEMKFGDEQNKVAALEDVVDEADAASCAQQVGHRRHLMLLSAQPKKRPVLLGWS